MYGFEDHNEDNLKIIDNIINYLFELWYIHFLFISQGNEQRYSTFKYTSQRT